MGNPIFKSGLKLHNNIEWLLKVLFCGFRILSALPQSSPSVYSNNKVSPFYLHHIIHSAITAKQLSAHNLFRNAFLNTYFSSRPGAQIKKEQNQTSINNITE